MPIGVPRCQPRDADVTDLIRAAENHSLGLDFLVRGHLGTVAITFGCHAFTVVAARDRLTDSSEKKSADRTTRAQGVSGANGAESAAE